ncbi:hypothetical protein QMK17_24200 [Rhodococcus sp. G-MC3]|uniref:hypothetical protein n=1 Tax=Rhodococcus sp. G-MC3 TaxID=3046209 RepID=UPI0024BB8730|nr:hypothetical protein [Rhodococcus sp. G-MC3]MDJ0396412.1 hypothetical protein [Rhodococcus sp. G-MC3]
MTGQVAPRPLASPIGSSTPQGKYVQHNYTEPAPANSNRFVIDVAVDALDIEDGIVPPPAVGSDTTWLLSFYVSDKAAAAEFPGHPIWIPRVQALRSGGITAYVRNSSGEPIGDMAVLKGTFRGTMLGGSTPAGLPATTGVVVGLQIRSQVYRELRPPVESASRPRHSAAGPGQPEMVRPRHHDGRRGLAHRHRVDRADGRS